MANIVITGSSSGIGAAAAVQLTRLGHRVLTTGRSAKKLEEVHRRMISVASSSLNVPRPVVADISRIREVKRLADIICDRFSDLDVLVNNAAVQPARRQVTPDGHELALGVNHLAHFLLTKLLLEKLESSQGRVINTASSSYKRGYFDFDDMQMKTDWSPSRSYGRSKLANILFTMELRKRTTVPVAAFHPGAIRTDINRESPFVKIVKPFERIILSEPEQGAETMIWLATGTQIDDPEHIYYVNRNPEELDKSAQDSTVAEKLWGFSEKIIDSPIEGP